MSIQDELIIFSNNYNFEKKTQIWKNHRKIFQDIWNDKILSGTAERIDFDDLVFIIDSNARNSTKNDEAVAKTYLRYSIWYKFFNDLNDKPELREKIDSILKTDREEEIVKSIDKLYEYNKNNKNGLTTKNAIILNALLFLNSPDQYISSLSLKHRRIICEKLGLIFSDESVGTIIIETNKIIIDYFDRLLPESYIDSDSKHFIKDRMISDFIYSEFGNNYFWQEDVNIQNNRTTFEITEPEINVEEQSFYLEKYLEHFIYTNWDNITELEEYEFILNEDNEPVSLQFNTGVGIIDLLVRNKKDRSYLVIELKRGKTSDKTIGQIARYMGWVSKEIADKENVAVKGLIIAESFDEKIKYSLSCLNNVKTMKYKISFGLEYDIE